jgi:hypothetical protein
MTQAAYFSHAAGSASQPAASTSHSAQFQQYTGASSQAAGTSSQGPPLDHAGTSSDRLLSSTVLFDITDLTSSAPHSWEAHRRCRRRTRRRPLLRQTLVLPVLCHRIVSPTPRTTCEHRPGGPSVVAARGRASRAVFSLFIRFTFQYCMLV